MSFVFQIKSAEEYHTQYKKSIENPTEFWFNIAQHFIWKKKPSIENALSWNFTEPNVQWFKDATLNVTENCIDKHANENPNKIAFIWEPNNSTDDTKKITYKQLLDDVCAFANLLKNHNVKKGDTVCIYMGMIPQLAVAVLACARIGAIHSVVFGGFSAQSIKDRLIDADVKFIITQDAVMRGNKKIELKNIIDEAINNVSIHKIFVWNHLGTYQKNSTIEINCNEEIKQYDNTFCQAEEMNAEDPLFILYTSGSTGKPKGVVHSCAGYMIYTTYTFVNVFQYMANQIYFCTADVGWITGHSYLIYGPLCAGATSVMFEGVPTYPDAGRLWDIVDKHRVNILYTAPTAIRSLMAYGDEFLLNKKLDSLQVLGTVGEPINEEAWNWYYTNIGKQKCPIVDTWWQTETGGILISNLAGITPHIPVHATLPLPGIQVVLVDENGVEIPGSNSAKLEMPKEIISGNLCIQFPWPSIIRTTWGDHERCRTTYFSTYKNKYFTGDGCFRDTQGNYRITGRVDDVLNVSGHRIGTAEVENAINSNEFVIESAVVGFPHDIKGQGIFAFVITSNENQNHQENIIIDAIKNTVVKLIGAIARPDKICIVSGLPKTRSGKIMRRILRKLAEGETENLGDITTLLDPTVVDEIKNKLTKI